MIADTALVNAGMVVYVAAFVISIWRLHSNNLFLTRWNVRILCLGWLLHTAGFFVRWRATYLLGYNYFPVANRYESLVFYGWCIALAWLILQRWVSNPGIAAGMQFFAASVTAWAGLFQTHGRDIDPLMPALQSNWLLFHVVTCFFAYAAFTAAAFIALHFLYRILRNPDLNSSETDNLLYRCVSIGFFMLTLGILSGSAWAQKAWGRYWGWDPKEVWSLITWIIYALFLHLRVARGWRAKKLALLAVVGFLAMLFTFLGVNYLPFLSGLHSYA
jgi:cytochrome c-type biogenesis protein CcsB